MVGGLRGIRRGFGGPAGGARYDQADKGSRRVDVAFSGWFHGPILGAVLAF